MPYSIVAEEIVLNPLRFFEYQLKDIRKDCIAKSLAVKTKVSCVSKLFKEINQYLPANLKDAGVMEGCKAMFWEKNELSEALIEKR
ncbi:uncharacterized protein DFL_009687 [Arthrobotrys flagrans]|uniref:Uncharacterized protein n=1 Tax=Arthrobotrys flagrans TaxID=97331 RepID=A0A436ZSC7_ARTFL|nr:hypothetical protein DFL_009687 [Arthrobotrys flagrans]